VAGRAGPGGDRPETQIDDVEDYDYDNPADRDAYCPDMENNNDDAYGRGQKVSRGVPSVGAKGDTCPPPPSISLTCPSHHLMCPNLEVLLHYPFGRRNYCTVPVSLNAY